MAKKFQLIDIINEAEKVSHSNISSLYKRMMESEKAKTGRKTLGIKEMFDDFDAGSDPGEDEDDFRAAAGQGEFEDDMGDEEGMDDEMGDDFDEEGMDDEMGGEPPMSMDDEDPDPMAAGPEEHGISGDTPEFDDQEADEAGMGEPDEFDPEASAMDDDDMDELGDEEMDDESEEFTPPSMADDASVDDEVVPGLGDVDGIDSITNNSIRKNARDKTFSLGDMSLESKGQTLIQMLDRQVNEMKGVKPKKALTPRKSDFFITESRVFGRFDKKTKDGYSIKMNENKSFTLGLSSVKSARRSEDADIRRLAKSFKAQHPTRNVWVSI